MHMRKNAWDISRMTLSIARCQLPATIRGVLIAAGLMLLPAAFAPQAVAQTSDLVVRSALRVCADPANMPMSNKKRQGYENKIAKLLADDMGVPVIYTWFPQATGFLRMTLNAKRCDVVIGFSAVHELVLNTNDYVRSTYILVFPKGSPLEGVTNLDDERLKGKKIGVVAGSPPATILAMNDLIGNARPYQLMVDRRHFSPSEKMVQDIAKGEIDAGVLWGPIGGYYAKNSETPMTVVPLIHETKGPRMAYRITMAVRHGEKEWKHRLNKFIRTKKNEINAILSDYGVPLLDNKDHIITVEKSADK